MKARKERWMVLAATLLIGLAFWLSNRPTEPDDDERDERTPVNWNAPFPGPKT